MILPDENIQKKLDGLIHSGVSFALYRLPWTDECRFILQSSDDVECLTEVHELNGKKGFVMAPFRQSEEHPLVVIRPDVMACGWMEIQEKLSAWQLSEENMYGGRVSEISSFYDEEADRQLYEQAFQRFIVPLRTRRFQKLVLSRSTVRPVVDDFSPIGAFVHACNNYPRMMVYLCHTPVSGTWMGSTPEILLSGEGRKWHTVALAGTMPMRKEVMPTEWSSKNKEEQEYVARYIREIVCRFGNEMTEEGPYTARAGQLVHLKSDFHFLLEDSDRLGDLLQELHPTPAVCGLPKEEAFRFIGDCEGYDRSYYSGFAGWLDPEGKTNLYVNLRCMELHAGKVTLYAGGGILSLSEVEQEWEETREKMQTMIAIMGNREK